MNLQLITNPTREQIHLLMDWRKKVQQLWKETFKVTYSGTKKWIEDIIINPERMLFFVIKDGKEIGQVGFDHIGKKQVFIGSIIRGRGKSDGSMTEAIVELIRMAFKFQKPTILLQVLKSNEHAIKLYKEIGFSVIEDITNSYIMKFNEFVCSKLKEIYEES